MRDVSPFGVLIGVVFSCLFTAGSAMSAPAFVKADSWQESVRLSREAITEYLKKDVAEGNASGPVLGPWYQAGPFTAGKEGFKTAFPPISGVDITKKCGGKSWQRMDAYVDGKAHALKAPGNAATFLYRTITVPKAQKFKAYFGSDDALGVWLNGKSILSQDVKRGYGANQDSATLELQPGENKLLVMIYNYLGGHGFYFSTRKTPGSVLDELLSSMWSSARTAFPGTLSARQMGWERGDGIWVREWASGDLRSLAQRYATIVEESSYAPKVAALVDSCNSVEKLCAVREQYYLYKWSCELDSLRRQLDTASLRRAVGDLSQSFHDGYPAERITMELSAFEAKAAAVIGRAEAGEEKALQEAAFFPEALASLKRRALLANPLLNFERILFVKRKGNEGLTQNWQGNDRLHGRKMDNEIASFSLTDTDVSDQTIYRPEDPIFVGDVDLHFDAEKLMFSTNGTVCEVHVDGSGFRKVISDIESYDPCYLADDRILFISNSGYHAVPCVSGGDYVGNIHIASSDGTGIRRLCFDQDNNWNPTLLPNGRVLYTRWEYTDSAHYFSRVLMHMNPDGTNQVEFYGSNSYWPNSMFYSRPIPGSPTQFVTIVSGHHGPARMGELVLFDAARGRYEASGAIQMIPGYGKTVEPLVLDNLVGNVWPKFLHPYPLSDKYFLVSCRPTSRDSWGIYLVDVFDNMIPLRTIPGVHCMEPVPLRKVPRPPLIPDRIDPSKEDATVYITDVYQGQGLEGVPKGTVKALRVYQYEYAYRHTGGHYVVGYEGPWDVRRLLGTVPVFEDGSAVFSIPANIPLALQPLDQEGKALALMRSWFVGMPGEVVSCIGCHDRQSKVPPASNTQASRTAPLKIKPWYGPKRGFSFRREVQPVLDQYCVGCHNGKKEGMVSFVDDGEEISFPTAQSKYSKPYLALHPYVRRNGPEGDYHILTPLEFHADTSELVQMLQKGHHGVTLSPEAWDRIITWIDLNVPYHGTWKEATQGRVKQEYVTCRYENRIKYAGVEEDIERIPNPYTPGTVAFLAPKQTPKVKVASQTKVDGWPFDLARARALQGDHSSFSVDLADGIALTFVKIPAGSFVMGSPHGDLDEQALASVTVEQVFWMADCEITNAQYAQFDPAHDSGVYDKRYKDQVNRGYYVNQPENPAIRVSWQRAVDFCKWLSEKSGYAVTLPTEAQWEWACRAGTDTELFYGDANTDFAEFANLADVTTKELAVRGVNPKPIPNPHPLAAYLPAALGSNDKVLHLASPKTYKPNAWGLYDMHGNVAEWTRSKYQAYPYRDDDGRNELSGTDEKRVVRGGSWHDRPRRARSAFRLAYPAWQRVFNVGFRPVILDGPPSGRKQAMR